MSDIQTSVEDVVDRSGLGRTGIRYLRGISTVGIVIGVSITVSALFFPTYPEAFLQMVLGSYREILELLVVDERLFSLITGFFLMVASSIVHLSLDLYLGAFKDIRKYSRETKLKIIVMVTFFLAFMIARVAVILSGIVGPETSSGVAGFIPINEIWFNGYHIHHFFFGFIALTAAGWFSLFHRSREVLSSVLYGAGLGIFVDEFGMLLTEGNYFAQSSYFVAMTFLTLLLIGIYWDRVSNEKHKESNP